MDAHGNGLEESYSAVSASATVVNVNDDPVGALTVTGTARQGRTLALADAVTDADGVPGGGRLYQWQAEGEDGFWTDIAGATGTSLALTQAEVGHAVRVVLGYTDAHGTPEYIESAATLSVENANDAPAGALTVAGTAREGGTLTLTLTDTVTDAIPTGGRAYKWQAEGGAGVWTDVAGATGTSLALTQAEVGRAVRAILRYTDGGGAAETVLGAATPAVENTNDAPVGVPAALGGPGAPVEGGPVAADLASVSDADGLGTFAYTWSRETGADVWTAIEGADGASYTPGDADVGRRLKVQVSYTDAGGAEEGFVLVTASPVANVNDAPTGAVVLDGDRVRGQTITASVASIADADGMGEVSLRWERGDGPAWTPIAGATGARYTLQAADIGHALRAVATWTDARGTVEPVSAETGEIAPRAVVLPPPEAGEEERVAAAHDWTSTDLGARLADGDVFAPPPGADSVTLADGVLSSGPGTGEAFFARLYLGLLGREGDAGGLAFLGEAARAGASRADLAGVILSSAEYGAGRAASTDAEFVGDLYQGFFGREGADEERGVWEAALGRGASRAEAALGIADSAEARDHLQAATDGVFVPAAGSVAARSLYHCALGREADASGLVHWSRLLAGGADPRTIGAAFGSTLEFEARHAASTDGAFVEGLYRDGLGREADAAGLDHWVGLLHSGGMDRGEVALHLSMAQEARDGLDWVL